MPLLQTYVFSLDGKEYYLSGSSFLISTAWNPNGWWRGGTDPPQNQFSNLR